MGHEHSQGHPEGHPISVVQARELLAGELGDVYRGILRACCAPIYWHSRQPDAVQKIHSNGTVSFAKIGERKFGITAAHVIRGYIDTCASENCILQIGNAEYHLDLIDMDEQADIALLNVSKLADEGIGKVINHIEVVSPKQAPQEGRGIMLAGYPGEDWSYAGPREVCWGLFTAIGTVRTINHDQISWMPDHAHNVPARDIPTLPPNKELGGISGGPLIAWFEQSTISYPVLAGVVSEAQASFDYVISRRLDIARLNAKIAPTV